MPDTVVLPDGAVPYTRFRPERLAWGVLIISFMIFCVFCVTSTVWLQYFFFQSSVPMRSVLQVGRGTVGIREGVGAEQAETRQRDLSNGVSVRTDRIDSFSQATLSFYDSEMLIAMVILRGDTQARFDRASQPRFDWSTPIYEVDLIDFSGRADVIVTEGLSRDIVFSIKTTHGVEARLGDSGRYVVSSSDTRTRVINYQGQAILIAADRQTTSSIPTGQEGIIPNGENSVLRQPTYDQLLSNNTLETYEPDSVVAGSNIFALPTGQWACQSVNTPRGEIRATTPVGGHDTLHLIRMNGATNSGELRCEQFLGDPLTGLGINVTSYTYLALQALVKIDFQSLSACGEQASECPVMLRLDYFDAEGRKKQWYQGVYARLDPGVDYRLSCDSCPRDHVLVYEDAWYLYDSGNLFDLFPPGPLRPIAVTDITFYAAGHQYDVYVDEVSLFVGNINPASTIIDTLNAPAADER